jgi:predicted dehydrogenase
MTDAPLRMGVIGLGFMGGLHARLWHELPHTRLVAVADIDEATGQALARTYGCAFHQDSADLLARDDIDAVSIVTPDRLHVAPAMAAAAAGKHILLEKPMAHDGAAAAEIAAAVDRHDVRLMVAHVLRFDPRYVQLRAAADPAQLGDPIHLRAKRNSVRSLAQRLGSNSSVLYYLGVHDIDMLQWVARSPITRVYAQKVQKLSNGNEDALYAVLNFANGAIGTLDYSWAWPDGLPNGYWVHFEAVGTKGASFLEVRDQGLHIVTADGSQGADTHLWPEINGEITGILKDELMHFATAVLKDRPFVQDWREAEDAIRVIDAIFASIDSAAPVDVARG